ncbi:TetR/AcrR family transcriptional regulator [Acidiferrimicrobium sp. IK]|uniref:TetR/AcrR family transcriptional regulator n=1 Tax=Acidiferrimicrobium sp. IK TaxID=2871700 RepID=UPI0021CB1E84|nr:TetR/AcrR family transcriptional regulator [Acidiferrimicrobium sp. IK]MCU4183515.1 TetR/AcrR family transcriptional regulator [Acidiferrimicrobium sp. IK]
MARRGAALRDHILDSAKVAFLESGFERTSMDAIAARAETSKRSLYAYFPTKDNLFVAVVARIREQFAARLLSPSAYAADPPEAIARYLARFDQLLRWSSVVLTLRVGMGEADRLPAVAAGLDDALFGVADRHLDDYLASHYRGEEDALAVMRDQLLGFAVYPLLPRLLLGVEPMEDVLGDADGVSAATIERARAATRAIIDLHLHSGRVSPSGA